MRALLLVSVFLIQSVFAEQGQREHFDKWWPICVFDGTGGSGETNQMITDMVDMAAECKVHLDVYAFPIPSGSDGDAQFSKQAVNKCNATYGFKSLGVNRASVLAVVDNNTVAKNLCSAMGAKDKNACGMLSFDPGEGIKTRMKNTGTFGGIADKSNGMAFSVVSGKSRNARDASAVALGQGMMALPQGNGAGNGVGSQYEGQAAGGSNVDSGWSEEGCRLMRAAAYDNAYRNMVYIKGANIQWLSDLDRDRPINLNDGRNLFGNPAGQAATNTASIPSSTQGGSSGSMGASDSQNASSGDAFWKARSSAGNAKTSSTDAHPNKSGTQVVQVRKNSQGAEYAGGDENVNVPTTPPTRAVANAGNKIVSVENDQKEDAELAALKKKTGYVESGSTTQTAASLAGATTSTPSKDNSINSVRKNPSNQLLAAIEPESKPADAVKATTAPTNFSTTSTSVKPQTTSSTAIAATTANKTPASTPTSKSKEDEDEEEGAFGNPNLSNDFF